MQTVSFHTADKQLTIRNRALLKQFIANIFDLENKPLKKLDYVFCSDEYLLQINKDFLNHDYYTDIITFPLSDKQEAITAEVYVSLDRVRDNANQHGSTIHDETLRVLFHGALHLCGYGDKSPREAEKMRNKEDYYINQFHVEQ
ncbi:rRNA maturation RNase YbeY [Parasediminibacterium paludis]|uniref:Endoribonuclease YbeY n=1 Tax=Parasediminibacterium paludis TaxID=908966 RepID=A0ABV8Q0H5_9BACT